ncbi:E3 ubiquitin-protein ligase RMA1H1 [Cardamine amara subsp. amara]|uniref:E3 ubiquitin-protein ligase RMA n=1 Tax=Cardamine amara subsp. amara TaxID=228776 RepID=A0ABD1BD41_CARAN
MSSNTTNTNEEDASNNFGCNICLELAKEPIVTQCGHLFCWPCLYKWLHFNSKSNHCPVCKALVKVDSLVPLYGMGKPSSDPRSKLNCCGASVPNRPSATRIETNRQRHHGSSLFGGHSSLSSMPTGTRFGNFLL